MATEIVFLHERYPFGGGEKVTATVAAALTGAGSDIHVTVVAGELDRRHTPDTPGVTHTGLPCEWRRLRHADGAQAFTAWLGSIAPTGVLVVPVDPPCGLLESVRRELPGWRTVFLLHGEPLWQVRNKVAQSSVKAMRERVLHTYTKRYIRRYREIYANVDRFAVLCDAYRAEVQRIVGEPTSEPHIIELDSMTHCNKIAFLLPSYVGGGAEKVTDRIVCRIKAAAPDTEVLLISTEFTASSLDEARRIGYTVEHFDKADGRYYSTGTTDRVIEILERHGGVDILVMTVDMLKDVERIREALPECKLVYHLHGRPLWEVSAKLTGSHRDVAKTGSRMKMAKWWLTKYAKEKVLGLYTARYSRHYRHTYNDVDRFVVLCDGYRDEVESMVGAGNESRVVAMYNPLPESAVAMTAEAATSPRENTVLYVGRLSYEDKRVDRLIRIWAKVAPSHPDWHLRIVGDGKERQALETQVKELGVSGSVEFCGYAPDPSEYYRHASILCLTSEFEGWPLVLAEAQAAGVWPMAFGCSAGIKELIGTDGTRGSLVTPYDEEEYARTLADLMDHPERLAALRPDMVESTLQYAPENVAERWRKLFDEIESVQTSDAQ